MTIENIAVFSSICLAAMASPGPAVIAVVGRALTLGWRRNIGFIAGIVCGDLTVLLLVLFGMGAIADHFVEIVTVVKVLGGFYLIGLGVKTLIARSGGVDMQSENRESGLRALLGGYALTMGNPKAIMFYIAIVPLIIDLKNITMSDFAVVSAIIVIILSSVLMGYSLGSSGVRRFFSDPVWRRRVDCVAGLVLVAVGIAIWFG